MSTIEKLAEKQIAEIRSKYLDLDLKVDELNGNIFELKSRLRRISDLMEKQFAEMDKIQDAMEKSLRELDQFYPPAPVEPAVVSSPKTYHFDFTKHG